MNLGDLGLYARDPAAAGRGSQHRFVLVDRRGALPNAALQLRSHLAYLAEERLAAREYGLAAHEQYQADLELEFGIARAALAGSVVLQIALLRAALDGSGQG